MGTVVLNVIFVFGLLVGAAVVQQEQLQVVVCRSTQLSHQH
jgi:hypothetical protein